MGQCSGKLAGGGDRADILDNTAWIRRVVTGYQDNRKQGQNMDNTSVTIKVFTIAAWQAAVKISVYLSVLSVCVCLCFLSLMANSILFSGMINNDNFGKPRK